MKYDNRSIDETDVFVNDEYVCIDPIELFLNAIDNNCDASLHDEFKRIIASKLNIDTTKY